MPELGTRPLFILERKKKKKKKETYKQKKKKERKTERKKAKVKAGLVQQNVCILVRGMIDRFDLFFHKTCFSRRNRDKQQGRPPGQVQNPRHQSREHLGGIWLALGEKKVMGCLDWLYWLQSAQTRECVLLDKEEAGTHLPLGQCYECLACVPIRGN